jgi:hypothetical protein
MALDGLHGRLYGAFLLLMGHPSPFAMLAQRLDFDVLAVAWPVLVVGTSWFGALSALLMRMGWAWKACLVLGGLSLFYLGPGSVLGLGALLGLLLPATRAWLLIPAPSDEKA